MFGFGSPWWAKEFDEKIRTVKKCQGVLNEQPWRWKEAQRALEGIIRDLKSDRRVTRTFVEPGGIELRLIKRCHRCGYKPKRPTDVCKRWEYLEDHPRIRKGHYMDGRDVYETVTGKPEGWGRYRTLEEAMERGISHEP